MRIKKNTVITGLLVLLVLNGLVYGAETLSILKTGSIWYTLWGTCALIGSLSLYMYAKHLLVFFLLLLLASLVPGAQQFFAQGDARILATFWAIYSLFWLLYFELRKSRMSERIRLAHPLFQMMLYFAYLAFAVACTYALTGVAFFGRVITLNVRDDIAQIFLALVILIPTMTIAALRVIDMVGAKHFIHFLIGSYHRPVEREQTILFMDMAGSSGIAEKLSPQRSMALIARFIFDASVAFRSYGGDIVNYTGDGLVVLWPIDAAEDALRSVESLNARMIQARQNYMRGFGIVPSFRIGIHAGPVVLAKIGEEKLFLGVYGDAVNTAARLEALNKTFGTRVMVSQAVKHRLDPAWRKRFTPHGETAVSGREQKIEVFSLALRD